MQVFYSVENLSVRYWAWCVKLHRKENVIHYYNNLTQTENCLICNNKTEATEIYTILHKGVSATKLISIFDRCGFNGFELYVYFMQNGIIE